MISTWTKYRTVDTDMFLFLLGMFNYEVSLFAFCCGKVWQTAWCSTDAQNKIENKSYHCINPWYDTIQKKMCLFNINYIVIRQCLILIRDIINQYYFLYPYTLIDNTILYYLHTKIDYIDYYAGSSTQPYTCKRLKYVRLEYLMYLGG